MQQEIQSNNDIKIGSTIAFIVLIIVLLFAAFFIYQSNQTELDVPIVRKTNETPQIIDVLEIPQSIKIKETKPEKLMTWEELKVVYKLDLDKPTGFLSALLKTLSLDKSSSQVNVALLEFKNKSDSGALFFKQISNTLQWDKDYHSYNLNGLSFRLLDNYLVLSEFNESINLRQYLKSIYSKLNIAPFVFKSGRYLSYHHDSKVTNSHFSNLESFKFQMDNQAVYVSSSVEFEKNLGNVNTVRKYSIGNLTLQRVFNSSSNQVVYMKRNSNYVIFTDPQKKHLPIRNKAKLIKLFN